MVAGPSSYIQKYNQRIGTMRDRLNLQTSPTPSAGSNNVATNYSANNNYAVGSRTYNGTSNSPHAGSGGIDTGGYATRDNMNNTRRRMLMQMANKPRS